MVGGIEATFVDPFNYEEIEAAIKDNNLPKPSR